MNVIEIAKQAGVQDADWNYIKALVKFATLVAAHEREACAKLCDEQVSELYASRDTVDCAEYLAGQIRARSNT